MLAALIALVGTALGAAPAAAQPEQSDAVRVWNLHASDALINAPTAGTPGAGQAPPVSQLHLAMVQGAVYDAVNAIVGGYQPYLPDLPSASPSASQEAAVATAAHHVLVGLGIAPVPPLPQGVRDRLDALYAASLAAIPDGDAKTEGIAAGAAAAAAMLEARMNDGRFEPPLTWQVGADPGEWRPTLPLFANALAWVGTVEPFTLESTSQFRTKGPNALTSGAYAKEYNEVKEVGAFDAARTPAQTAEALFYTVHPPELFNRTFRVISEAQGLTLAEEARLFATLNLTTADSVINCFDDKAFWNFWRPITAIQEGDDDGNHKTVGDPDWRPLVDNPPYSDHPSGYNCVSAAYMYAAKAFFGTNKMDFSVVKTAAVPDVKRDYTRFTGVIDDTIDARVMQGLHFREAEVQGARIGKNVARWVDAHFFQPVK
ncbi:vanadium-dependent haloperoxidase [Microbacterium sp. CFBP9034]|uniref:vanadium-dependent haloperoxidase n=1 Tax=Microbacterium sp. CFBP9034 TaxID=3096540 RepID=UPI002A6A1ADE|nr:vanadium-dependent haloperoxidase [Microbacterium sp. CFBP9034]MDY0910145.1 vanadium-dependent haloperoxidase [Microbacterium sp. CFBP9034]